MKRLFTLFTGLCVMLLAGCNDEYDDSALVKRLDDFEQRLERLERLCNDMNTNLGSMQTIVTALDRGDYITSVEPLTENGSMVGYTIRFAKGTPIVVYNGKPGTAPVVSVKKDTDGIYYWTLDGEWITDGGKKLPVSGQNGTSPKLKIEEEYWYISYDDGTTWTKLDKATGEKGDDGAGILVDMDENYVYFTLPDGRTVTVPRAEGGSEPQPSVPHILYAVGQELVPGQGHYYATLWKDGKRQLLTDGSADSFCNGVYVDGNKVYVVGCEAIGDLFDDGYYEPYPLNVGVMWQFEVGNETQVTRSVLSDGKRATSPVAVAAAGENIYAAGFETLENSDSDMEAMDQFKLDLYKDEVFVFTPKGDLYKLPQGATVLDFAFSIHSNLGCRCTGARVNGKNVQLRQKLNSGDQVEIMTSNTQTPKRDWLTFVTTSKARNKIRQALKEIAARQTQFAKETLERKFKNRKLEYDEAILMRLIRKLGFKTVTDFYQSIANESMDVNDIIDKYLDMQKRETEQREEISYRSAEGFNIQQPTDAKDYKDDVLVIDRNLKGLDFTLARCCNPIYGDEVFGFVSINGGIKIHRCDCPNAKEMRSRFPYRIVKARWAGKSQGKQYPITLRIIGHDDIGIVTNITSIINKENNILLRSISIDSHDGLFSGMLTVTVDDNAKLESLIKKIKTVKGVKQVNR